MDNSVSFTQFVEHLGCHLKIGYHWSALSFDEKRLVVTIWDDQLIGDKYVLIPKGSPPWMNNAGGKQLEKHVLVGMSDGVETLGILCHAEDPYASRRRRAYYDDKYVLVLRLEKHEDQVVATVLGEVETEVAAKGGVGKMVSQRKSACEDLDDVPPGAEVPEKYRVEGLVFKRDRMVRAHVVRRANGKCEYCGADGFLMPNGTRYLEAHHIVGLGENGPDTVRNVIAVCPAHHREAHFGVNLYELNMQMQARIDELNSRV